MPYVGYAEVHLPDLCGHVVEANPHGGQRWDNVSIMGEPDADLHVTCLGRQPKKCPYSLCTELAMHAQGSVALKLSCTEQSDRKSLQTKMTDTCLHLLLQEGCKDVVPNPGRSKGVQESLLFDQVVAELEIQDTDCRHRSPHGVTDHIQVGIWMLLQQLPY